MTLIIRVEVHEFEFDAQNLGTIAGANSIGGLAYLKGATTRIGKYPW